MKKFLYPVFIFILLAGSFLAGSLYSAKESAKSSASGGPPILHYVDTMNPSHTSEKPGLAPWGMKMEPVYAEGPAEQDSDKMTSSMPSGTVKISPEKQQIIGVKIGQAEKSSRPQVIRTLGRVAVDENRTHRLVAPSEGWVREIYGGTTGTLVKKDQVLAKYYSRDIISTLVGFYLALGQSEQYSPLGNKQAGVAISQLRTAEANLITLGMSEAQIEELKRTRQPIPDIEIRSPVSGFVLARNLSPSLRFDRNTELYRIADLSLVWVLANIYENEGRLVKPGTKVKIRLPNEERTFQGKVSDVLPQVDAATRTLKARLEVANPEYSLRPDMFVDVEFSIQLPPAITIPADAILDSGLKKTIFVDLGDGSFEPREVETGWRLGNRVEIVKGLDPGERIVISGNFLIDSESKLEMAAAGMQGALSKDPVCGLKISPKKAEKAGRKIVSGGKTYYFCSDECQQRFEKESNRFLRTNADATSAEGAPSRTLRKNQGHDHS